MNRQLQWVSAVVSLVAGGESHEPPSPRRRVTQGVVLALGAPFGWLALRVAWLQVDPIAEVLSNLSLYGYMTIGNLISYVLFSMRISGSESRLHTANRDLATLAVTDALTGLRNARFFQARVEEAVADASRSMRPLCLVVLDLDHFKMVNDTHGHPVGDEVLEEVSRRIHRCVRASDTAARVGGEEFALILNDTDPKGALVIAERVRCSIADAPIETTAGPLAVTASAGVAVLDGNSHAELYAVADDALYQAKATGRNRVVMAEPGSVSE